MAGIATARLLLLVSVALPTGLSLGCGPPRDAHEQDFVQSDSSGVLISITPGAAALASAGWRVDSIPNFEVGGGASAEEALYRVQGVRGLPGGRVLVMDAGSAELRFFDSAGRLVQRVGARGEGPGEFMDPVLLQTPGGDSLVVFDAPLLRLQVFSQAGEHQGVLPLWANWPGGRRPPLGLRGDQMLLERGIIVGGYESLREDGLHQIRRSYRLLQPATGQPITLVASFDYGLHYQFSEKSEAMVPFAAIPAAAVGTDEVWITDGRTPEIRGYDVNGQLVRILRVDVPRRPVTKEMVASLPLDPNKGWRNRRIIEQIPKPDTLPFFRALMVDDLGWLWAEVYRWDPSEPREWIVFDREGRARGLVQTPPELELGRTLLGVVQGHIGRDFVVGVWRDELDVEHIRRYGLTRGQSR